MRRAPSLQPSNELAALPVEGTSAVGEDAPLACMSSRVQHDSIVMLAELADTQFSS